MFISRKKISKDNGLEPNEFEETVTQVLKGMPDRPEVALVRLREIKYKIDRKVSAHDKLKNIISVKDVVKVLDGPWKGSKDLLNISTKGDLASRFAQLKTLGHVPQSPGRMPRGRPPIDSGGRFRGHPALIGTSIRVCVGPFKGYSGVVKDVKGPLVRVELEFQIRIITVNHDQISDSVNALKPLREPPRYGAGSETPLPSRTPLQPYTTPMRDSGGGIFDPQFCYL